MNDKKPLLVLLFLAVVYFIGFAFGYFSRLSGGSDGRDLRERLEQVNRDLYSAIESQREASERASRLQAELQGFTEYARDVQERAGRLEDQFDGIINQSRELGDGISRAFDSLEESRILLDELGNILRSLP